MVAPGPKWSIEVEPIPGSGLPSTQVIMLELDPRTPQLSIGPRNVTGGGPELWQRAVIRVPIPIHEMPNKHLVDWLNSPAVTSLLKQVSDGYRAEMLWSGDYIGHWSQLAIQAVDSLVLGLGEAAKPQL